MERPFLPSWNRVVSAIPDIYDQLIEAVDKDLKEFQSTIPNVKSLERASL